MINNLTAVISKAASVRTWIPVFSIAVAEFNAEHDESVYPTPQKYADPLLDACSDT